MGKFKVGDRVRATVDSAYSVKKGDVCTVTEILNEQTIRFQKSDGTIDGWCSKNFELVDQPWQPKVGDRVRFKEKYGHHNAGDEVTVTGVDEVDSFGNCIVYTDTSHSVYLRRLEPLPVAAEAQPAAMTIEAGKFYRTRDGRKVGPMVAFYDDGRCFASSGTMNGGLWNPDGSAWFTGAEDSPVLIAEWVDDVPVAATASNDNAAPAKPAKFKVGDRVTGKDCIGEPISGTITYVDENDDSIPYSIDGRWCHESDISLSPAATPQQSTSTPSSTAGFTIPIVDEEPANDNTLTVTIALDADDFHEELDEIIAKLKKIRKLQRQTGLAA